jgi:hypothetical protein
MDQVANWVRFADTKATILTAGLGVVLTMFMTNAKTVADAMSKSCPAAVILGGLAAATLLSFAWTLFWLIRAIKPRSKMQYTELNRFAWPSLLRATSEQLAEHASRVEARTDAWRQVLDLSMLANRKFDACSKAVNGFAVLVLFGLACVAVAVGFTV